MEILDIYDRFRNLTGKKIKREDKSSLKKGEYYSVVHAAIFNSENEMLIQKRQSNKHKFPNLWDISVGGHVTSGEINYEAIERELFEELGIEYDFTNENPYLTITDENVFDDIYIINLDYDINKLKLQYDEVQNATWATKTEIFQLIEEGKFIPYNEGFIELLFYNSQKRGIK